MYHIPHRLEKDPDAGLFIRYGKSLVDAFPAVSEEEVALINLISPKMSKQFISNCEDIGLDHRDDDLRTDYVLYQSQRPNINKINFVMVITTMARAKVEPLNFDNEDHLYYILGYIGTSRVAELVNDILREAQS